MNWIFIGLLAGSLVTSGHDTKEACEGRWMTMAQQKVERGQCVEMKSNLSISGNTSSGYLLCSNGTCR